MPLDLAGESLDGGFLEFDELWPSCRWSSAFPASKAAIAGDGSRAGQRRGTSLALLSLIAMLGFVACADREPNEPSEGSESLTNGTVCGNGVCEPREDAQSCPRTLFEDRPRVSSCTVTRRDRSGGILAFSAAFSRFRSAISLACPPTVASNAAIRRSKRSVRWFVSLDHT